MKIVVTGGAGFIGSNLVRVLAQDPQNKVVVIDSLTYAGNAENLDGVRAEMAVLDIRSPIVRWALTTYKPTLIFHLAAQTHVDRSIDDALQFVGTNVVGTADMLSVAHEVWRQLPAIDAERFRFVYVSTDEVYGTLGDTGSFTEDSQYAPNSPYAATKAAGDHLVRAYNKTYGLPTIITHCSNNYGPYQFPEKLVPLAILNAIEGKAIPVYGTGENTRDWIHVDDHCEALVRIAAMGVPGETYNIGAWQERTTLQVVWAICDALDKLYRETRGSYRDLIQFVPDRPGHDWRYSIDASKLRDQLGWSPKVPFEQGIVSTVKWYWEHIDWCKRTTVGKYGRERLGLAK